MQVVAGQKNSSANKLQLKKTDCFGLLSSKNQLWQKHCILCDDAATESHVMFLHQHTTDLQTFREKIIQTGLSQTHLQVFVSKFWKMKEHLGNNQLNIHFYFLHSSFWGFDTGPDIECWQDRADKWGSPF